MEFGGKVKLIASVLLITGSFSQLGAYCFYNRTNEAIDVLVFKNKAAFQSMMKGLKWTGKGGEVLTASGEVVGKIDDPRAVAAAGAVGVIAPIAGDIVLEILIAEIPVAKHLNLNPGENACWNWADIRKNKRTKNVSELYFVVFSGGEKYDTILFQGSLGIECGLGFDGTGNVASFYPFKDKQGKEQWATLEGGKARGWTLIKRWK